MIEAALAPWGRPLTPPRLISHRENAVYDVSLPQGRAALRLHRQGYRSRAQIASELIWTEGLAARGFPCPCPLRTKAGDLTHQMPDGQVVTLIEWVEGEPIGDALKALPGTRDQQTGLYVQIGGLLADLHSQSDALDLPHGFTRPLWDRDALTGPDPLWGRYWNMPLLTRDDVAEILAARDRARATLEQLGADLDQGLIHSDALQENMFRTPRGLTLLDFDDGGFGFRMYDLASCLTQLVDEPAYPDLVASLMDGYAARRPLPDASRASFGMFAMLRCFSALGWTIPRMAPDHPRLPIHKARALRLARAFLAEA